MSNKFSFLTVTFCSGDIWISNKIWKFSKQFNDAPLCYTATSLAGDFSACVFCCRLDATIIFIKMILYILNDKTRQEEKYKDRNECIERWGA